MTSENGNPFSHEAADEALSKPLFPWTNDGATALFVIRIGPEPGRDLLAGKLTPDDVMRRGVPVAAVQGHAAWVA